MIKTEDFLCNHNNAVLIDVCFFRNNDRFRRRLVVEAHEEIDSILSYLQISLGEIVIGTVSCIRVVCLVNHEKLNKPSGIVLLEEYWGDAVLYVINYKDIHGNIDGFLVVGDENYESNELENKIKKTVKGINIDKIEEYHECWVKRQDKYI